MRGGQNGKFEKSKDRTGNYKKWQRSFINWLKFQEIKYIITKIKN